MTWRLSTAGVPSRSNNRFWERSGEKVKSYLPFTISTGFVIRGAKSN